MCLLASIGGNQPSLQIRENSGNSWRARDVSEEISSRATIWRYRCSTVRPAESIWRILRRGWGNPLGMQDLYAVKHLQPRWDGYILYRLLPDHTYFTKVKKWSTTRETKGMKAKFSVSAYLGTNTSGSAKVDHRQIIKPRVDSVCRPARSNTTSHISPHRRTQKHFPNGGWRRSFDSPESRRLPFRCCYSWRDFLFHPKVQVNMMV